MESKTAQTAITAKRKTDLSASTIPATLAFTSDAVPSCEAATVFQEAVEATT